MKGYRLKVGNEWALGGSGGYTTEHLEQAKVWKKPAHVKSHIAQVLRQARRYNRDNHAYLTNKPEIVEISLTTAPQDGFTLVSLPSGHSPIADFLESCGYLEQANTLRGG